MLIRCIDARVWEKVVKKKEQEESKGEGRA